jgi:uncharacterized protein (TIGR03083 family)
VTPGTPPSQTAEGDGDFQGTAVTGKALILRVQLDEVKAAFRTHRNRLIAELSELTEKEWNGPTRCHLWSVADVASHLTDGTRWGLEGLHAVLSKTDFSFMTRFDNRLTPHEYVQAGRGRAREEIAEDLATGTERLLMAVERVRELGHAFMQTPIGHVSLTFAVLHLLWDSWLHERDVLVPLSGSPLYPTHEVRLVASYALLLAGTAISSATTTQQRCDIVLDGPGGGYYRMGVEEAIHVEVGIPGPAVGSVPQGPILSTIDALAGRGHLKDVVNGPPDAIRLLCVFSTMMRPLD